MLGPWHGAHAEGAPTHDEEVVYDGTKVATLTVAAAEGYDFTDEDRAFLKRVALLISPHCLVGWDTGGVPWPEVR